MIEKERAAVMTLVMLNAFQYLLLGDEPNNDALELNLQYVLHTVRPHLETTEAICALAVVGHCLQNIERGTPVSRAHIEHPELYSRLEGKFLGNVHIRNFLSVVADAYEADGEPSIKNFLIAKGAYIANGSGKDAARRSISNTPKHRGFWASLFG